MLINVELFTTNDLVLKEIVHYYSSSLTRPLDLRLPPICTQPTTEGSKGQKKKSCANAPSQSLEVFFL